MGNMLNILYYLVLAVELAALVMVIGFICSLRRSRRAAEEAQFSGELCIGGDTPDACIWDANKRKGRPLYSAKNGAIYHGYCMPGNTAFTMGTMKSNGDVFDIEGYKTGHADADGVAYKQMTDLPVLSRVGYAKDGYLWAVHNGQDKYVGSYQGDAQVAAAVAISQGMFNV